MKPIDGMIEIWMEGYAATGESQTASLLWKGQAPDFDTAVANFIENADSSTKEVFKDRGTTLRPRYTIWGCFLFNNETEARLSFG